MAKSKTPKFSSDSAVQGWRQFLDSQEPGGESLVGSSAVPLDVEEVLECRSIKK